MNKNKVVIMMYQEGASRLDGGGRKNGNYALSCMVHDANVAADTLSEMGFEPFICDVYGIGRDVYAEEITPNAKKVSITELPKMLKEGEVCGVVMTGQHAKNGAPHAFMSFTVNEVAWFEYRLNGQVMGDIGIGATFVGAFGVPVLAVCGDKAACLEAKEYIEGVATGEVKSAQIRNWAKILPVEEGDANIANAVKDGIMRMGEIAPVAGKAPYHVAVTFGRVDFADDCIMYNNGVARRVSPLICDKTVEKIESYKDLRI